MMLGAARTGMLGRCKVTGDLAQIVTHLNVAASGCQVRAEIIALHSTCTWLILLSFERL